jgi:CBS domain-containing protein
MGSSTASGAGELGRPPMVHDVMRSALTTVERHSHLAGAAFMMHRAGSSAIVVVTDDERHQPIGVITEADITGVVADGRDVNEVRIEDMIGAKPVTVPADAPVTAAAERMMSARVRHLPVVDHDRLIGMLDITDACRSLLASATRA